MRSIGGGPRRRAQAGLSLIELMISITIGVFVLGAILAVYSSTSSASKQSESATRMSEDAAIALNFMASYIRSAGFSQPQINLPLYQVMNNGAMEKAKDTNFARAGVRGCDDGFANPTVSATLSLTCNTYTGTGTAAIAVRFQGDASSTNPSGANPTDCLNQAVTALTASDFAGAPAYPMIEARFFVRTAANSGTPELFCAGNGNNFVAQPIMQYVESINFLYGISETVGSGQVSQGYVNEQTIKALSGGIDQQWSRVISVKICLVMRSEMPDQIAQRGTYINCAGTVTNSPDRFLRRSFSTVVTLRNRAQLS